MHVSKTDRAGFKLNQRLQMCAFYVPIATPNWLDSVHSASELNALKRRSTEEDSPKFCCVPIILSGFFDSGQGKKGWFHHNRTTKLMLSVATAPHVKAVRLGEEAQKQISQKLADLLDGNDDFLVPSREITQSPMASPKNGGNGMLPEQPQRPIYTFEPLEIRTPTTVQDDTGELAIDSPMNKEKKGVVLRPQGFPKLRSASSSSSSKEQMGQSHTSSEQQAASAAADEHRRYQSVY